MVQEERAKFALKEAECRIQDLMEVCEGLALDPVEPRASAWELRRAEAPVVQEVELLDLAVEELGLGGGGLSAPALVQVRVHAVAPGHDRDYADVRVRPDLDVRCSGRADSSRAPGPGLHMSREAPSGVRVCVWCVGCGVWGFLRYRLLLVSPS